MHILSTFIYSWKRHVMSTDTFFFKSLRMMYTPVPVDAKGGVSHRTRRYMPLTFTTFVFDLLFLNSDWLGKPQVAAINAASTYKISYV